MKPLSKFFRRDKMNVPSQKYVFSSNEVQEIKNEIYKNL